MSQDGGGKLSLTVVTPERSLVDGVACDAVTLPGEKGELGILPGHTPLIALLGVGPVVYREGAKTTALAVRHGFAEVGPDAVRVLADEAATKETVDAAAATRAKEAAEKKFLEAEGDEALDALASEKAFAEAKLIVAGKPAVAH